MKNIIGILNKCMLFKNVHEEEIEKIIRKINYKIGEYAKDSVVAFEEDDCSLLGIIIDGTIEIRKIYSSGKNVTLTQLKKSHIFGEAIMFSNFNQYPATVISVARSKIIFIPKEEIVKICSQNEIILKNFMNLLSNKILMLNKKVKELSLDTLREKICFYLFEEHKKQKSLKIKLSMSREGLAKYMGVQRPSLSREMIKLRDEGIIDFDRSTVTIKDIRNIEDILI
ncbi:MAG: Crp/Fnr family transcriptional regulator [Anaeromicrobium sp.]|uniref:Crp/Fnr family transcriptional regulator n=1 Tax=Anaeromicrobium sp. TaxID=1929132 RepID=UPI0025FA1530|nr:Crp/Fnr family transcriptional regulator [Anaeromicrobium sp.]MCT4595189.1 Crp/Fnr family transcriptional regulator [Anaeromicrobium sp.]